MALLTGLTATSRPHHPAPRPCHLGIQSVWHWCRPCECLVRPRAGSVLLLAHRLASPSADGASSHGMANGDDRAYVTSWSRRSFAPASALFDYSLLMACRWPSSSQVPSHRDRAPSSVSSMPPLETCWHLGCRGAAAGGTHMFGPDPNSRGRQSLWMSGASRSARSPSP